MCDSGWKLQKNATATEAGLVEKTRKAWCMDRSMQDAEDCFDLLVEHPIAC